MKSKKFASAVLAGAMALSLTATAFAAGEDANKSGKIELPGEVREPIISVTVPAADGKVTLNPYKLSVELVAADEGDPDDEDDDTPAVISKDQVVSKVQYLTNLSECAIDVALSVTGKPATGVTMATAPIDESTKALTTKSVFMYVEAGVADSDDGSKDPSWTTTYDKNNKSLIVVSNKASAATKVATMAPGDRETDPEEPAAAAAKGYTAIKVMGNASAAPTGGWTAADTVAVDLAFTFTPSGFAVS